MDRIKLVVLSLIMMFVTSACSCNKTNDYLEIPLKQKANDTSTMTTPIHAKNLDQYLFRDDVQYVDLREYRFIQETGYIAGFQFIPYHSIIASFGNGKTLYEMKNVLDEYGNTTYAGQIGGFAPRYEESKALIKSLFNQDKYIFFVSQAGSEGSYIINLLIQLGYDGNKLYNICGVTGTEGAVSYISKGNPKYFVKGNTLINVETDYTFDSTLTPIN